MPHEDIFVEGKDANKRLLLYNRNTAKMLLLHYKRLSLS